MFNFNVVLSGHDMVSDASIAGITHAGEKSKPHHYKQNYKKNEGPCKNMGFNVKTV